MVGTGGIEAPSPLSATRPGKAAIGEWSLLDDDGDDGPRRTRGGIVIALHFRKHV